MNIAVNPGFVTSEKWLYLGSQGAETLLSPTGEGLGLGFGRARLPRQNDRNNRQTSYSFVVTELKIDGQSTEQWNKCNSSVIFVCGDVPVL